MKKQPFYSPLIKDNPGKPALLQRRDLLEQPLDYYKPDVFPATQPVVSKHYRKTQCFNCVKNAQWKYLLCVELVKLRLAVVFAPQTQDLRLGTVRHIDKLLEPPAFTDGAGHAPQDQTVVTHLCHHTAKLPGWTAECPRTSSRSPVRQLPMATHT